MLQASTEYGNKRVSVKPDAPERAECAKCGRRHRTATAAARCEWPSAENIYGSGYAAAPAFAVLSMGALYLNSSGVWSAPNVELYRDLDGALDAVRWHGSGGFDGVVRHADLFAWEDGEWREV